MFMGDLPLLSIPGSVQRRTRVPAEHTFGILAAKTELVLSSRRNLSGGPVIASFCLPFFFLLFPVSEVTPLWGICFFSIAFELTK